MSWDWQDLATRTPGPGAGNPTESEAAPASREEETAEAYQAGLREGEARGLERALRELDPSRQAAEKTAEQLSVLCAELEAGTQERVMALALAVSRKILEREVRLAPEDVAQLVDKALGHFPLDQKVRVRLHPADLSFLSGEISGGGPMETGAREVRWTPDESVSRGGCVVEGPEHVVDGRLETALERIYRTIFHD